MTNWPRYITYLFLLLAPTIIQAKPVAVKWESVENAIQYEIIIERAGAPVVSKTTTDAVWQGPLEEGFYVYRIRGIDPAHRPGEWSETLPLIVMPDPPDTSAGEGEETVELYGTQTIPFSWQQSPSFNKSEFELSKDGTVIYHQIISNSSLDLGSLATGHYTWRVRGLIVAGKQYPEFVDRQWPSAYSATRAFNVRHVDLAAPQLIWPSGLIWPSNDGLLEFRWSPVFGARAYEITLVPLSNQATHGTASSPSSGPLPSPFEKKVFRTETSRIGIVVDSPGDYTWSVRPLSSSTAPVDDSTQVNKLSFTVQKREFSRNQKWQLGVDFESGYLTVTSTDWIRNLTGTAGSTYECLNILARQWLHTEWGVEAALNQSIAQIGSQSAPFARDALRIVRRFDLGFGWSVDGTAGVQYQKLVRLELSPDASLTNIATNRSLGAEFGGAINRILGTRTTFQVAFTSYTPLLDLESNTAQNIQLDRLTENREFEASWLQDQSTTLSYRIAIKAVNAVVHQEYDSISGPDRTNSMTSWSALVGFIYKWGDR